MTTYIYLHGFNSGFTSDNPKVEELSEIGSVIGITYDTFASYQDIFVFLKKSVTDIVKSSSDHFVLVGTSLGGFWSLVLSQELNIPAVIINPAINPKESLKTYVDVTHTNYVTGVSNILASDVVDSYKTLDLSPKSINSVLLLLDLGDEVISSEDTYETLFPSLVLTPIIFSGGSHRFDHMRESLKHIKQFANFTETVF